MELGTPLTNITDFGADGATKTLYAKWVINQSDITFNPNGAALE